MINELKDSLIITYPSHVYVIVKVTKLHLMQKYQPISNSEFKTSSTLVA
jgi:hypothetical protein